MLLNPKEVEKLMLKYVKNGSLEKLEVLVNSHGLSVCPSLLGGSALLHNAFKFNQYEIAKFLLQQGAKALHPKVNEDSLLHLATKANQVEIVELLLEINDSNDTKQCKKGPPKISTEEEKKAIQELLSRRSPVDTAGDTPLHLAATQASRGMVETLLDKGASVDRRNKEKKTALYLGCMKGNREIVELLLRKGASLSLADKEGNKPLHVAAMGSDRNIVRLLLDSGANLDRTNNGKKSPLHFASLKGNEEVVRLLLDKGASYSTADEEGNVPLHLAAMKVHRNIVKMLLDKGANADVRNKEGKTALHFAVWEKDEEIVRILLSRGAAHSSADRKGSTPMHLAVMRGHQRVVELLIEHGANVNAADEAGRTPLHRAAAASERRSNIVEVLLKNNATVDATTKDKQTPLHFAAPKGNSCVEMLLNYQANVNATDVNGLIPLHLAADNRRDAIVELLLKEGANVDAVDKRGNTPLHFVAKYGYGKTLFSLLENQADVNVVNAAGYTPMHVAAKQGQSTVVGVLREVADVDIQGESEGRVLHDAVLRKDSQSVCLLLSRGINLSLEDDSGRTALQLAVGNGSLNPDARKIVHALKTHVIKLIIAKMDVSTKDLNYFETHNTEADRQDREDCLKEVSKMKEEKLCCHLTLFDIFSASKYHPKFLRNELLMEKLKTFNFDPFPNYRSLIVNLLRRTKRRLDLSTSGQKSLTAILKIRNRFSEEETPIPPTEILDEIVSYLSYRDLQNLNLCRFRLLGK